MKGEDTVVRDDSFSGCTTKDLGSSVTEKFIFKIGIELEFYSSASEEFLMQLINENFTLINRVEREKGINQFEISTIPTSDFELIVKEVRLFKSLTASYNNFSAKPFIGMPGSALHVHISMHDVYSMENFIVSDGNLKLFMIGGLCASLRASMLHFAPSIDSYKRFQYYDKFTPRFINWGFENNKTNAIRMTKNTIENRIPGADADIVEVLHCIFKGIDYGVENAVLPGKPNFKESEYSDSFSSRIPMSYSEATIQMRDFCAFKNALLFDNEL